MPNKQYDLVFFIGRQQPTTIPHTKTIVEAFDHGDQVAVLIGSVDIARDPKNPFTYEERRNMVQWAVEDAMPIDSLHWEGKFHIFGVRDDLYNNQIWASQVQNIVYNLTNGNKDAKVALIGHKKDASTFYLDMFPEWDFIETPSFGEINATDIRKVIFDTVAKKHWSQDIEDKLADMVPKSTISFLKQFSDGFDCRYNAVYANLVGEYNYLRHNEEIWKPAPYAHKDVTVDACVIQSGHVLVIRRKRFPGKGLLAMPGGHLEIDEEIEDGMLRELREEVKMKVPEPVIRGSIFAEKCFSHPKRSLRGRIITHAYGILLRSGPLPKLKAADDAAEAFWMPIAEFYRSRDQFFEDHWHMISYFITRAS